MLNILWGFLILFGIFTGILTGHMDTIGNASLDAAKEAVDLCFTMLGIMSLWTGLMEIAKTSGMISGLTRKLLPVIHFLFPGVPKNHAANEYIASNMIANLLGLGWAATPSGLKAMKELSKLRKETSRLPLADLTSRRSHESSHFVRRAAPKEQCMAENGSPDTASTDMCTFLIINISSLQLIPVNIIAYRSQYNSSNPASIIMPAIAATTVSTLAGIGFSILARKLSRK